jgi:rod shape-determining protein MreD
VNLAAGLPLLILGAMLQGSLLAHLRIQGGQADLVLLVVVAWSLLSRNLEGMAWAFAGGLFLDLFSGAPLGVSSIGLVLAAFLTGLGRAPVDRNNIILPPVMALVGTAIYHVSTLVLLVALGLQPPTWTASLSYVTLPSLLLNFALALPIFRLMGLLYARLHPRQRTVE